MAAMRLLVLGAVMATHTSRGIPTHPLKSATHESIIQAATYLTKFGYASSNPTEDKSDILGTLSNNLADFQRFAGLNVTGALDDATVQKMQEPRCGVKDKMGPGHRARRRKRYTLQGSRWRTKELTYKILNWPTNLQGSQDGVRKAVHDSYQAWANVSGLTFKEVSRNSKADIEITFASYDHGDAQAFDGPGNVLAHAISPNGGGNAHFDDSEAWTVDARQFDGTDLFTVAAHEFGHSLGIRHSADQRALMAPFYKPPSVDRDVIKEDDVNAIQALYGPPVKATARPVPRPRQHTPTGERTPDPILCADSSVDAMLTIKMRDVQRTFVFKGANYWGLTATGVEQGYPRRIRDDWGGVPDNLDAILPYEEIQRIYFFKGSQYWRMTNLKMDAGYPKLISRGFPGIPDNIDAAFKWVVNGKMYFFKGSQYWRFESELGFSGRPGVSDNYPQPIGTWAGIPDHIDSVLSYENKRTYFFKGNACYRFNDVDFMVDPSFPRSTGQHLFGCDH